MMAVESKVVLDRGPLYDLIVRIFSTFQNAVSGARNKRNRFGVGELRPSSLREDAKIGHLGPQAIAPGDQLARRQPEIANFDFFAHSSASGEQTFGRGNVADVKP